MNMTSIFFNHSFDKKKLKAFLYWVLKTFGEKEALTMVEELKRMGFLNATKAGLSIGLHDLKTPLKKRSLISSAEITMNKTDQEFQGAELTATERSQRIIDTWHRTSEDLRKQVVDYFSTYDQLNSVYMMALSGARGNFSQVRQLIGMRGLMADPQGQIISFPIRSNLREGLTLTEYFISCSGARKGLVDTALRTADTGYLTRRLVDISHHIVIKRVTCYTSRGIALKTLRTSQKVLLSLKERLVGRVLGENIYDESATKTKKTTPSFIKTTQILLPVQSLNKQIESKKVIARKNQEISPDLALKISLIKENGLHSNDNNNKHVWNTPSVLVRSPLTCTYTHEVCQLCYGWSMAQGSLVSLGEAVGVIAGQSIGEPGTQLTMRTFHTGGVFSGDLLQEIRAPHSGKIRFPKALQGLLIRTNQGKIAFLIKVSGELLIDNNHSDHKVELSLTTLPGGQKTQSALVNAVTASALENTNKNKETGKESSNKNGAEHKGKQKLCFGSRPNQSKAFVSPCVTGGASNQSKAFVTGGAKTGKTTKLSLEPSTILFVRQGEKVQSNQIVAELAITSEEGNQPIQSRQTLFSERGGRIVQWKSMLSKVHREKGTTKRKSQGESQETVYTSRLEFDKTQVAMTETSLQQKLGMKAYLGPVEGTLNSFGGINSCHPILDADNSHNQTLFRKFVPSEKTDVRYYEEMWGNANNNTLKQIVLSKRHGLGAIEPPKALELGLLSVIAIQIGASEKTSTKNITQSKLPFEQAFHLDSTFFNKVCSSEKRRISNKHYFGQTESRSVVQSNSASLLKHHNNWSPQNPHLSFCPEGVTLFDIRKAKLYDTKLEQSKGRRLPNLNAHLTGAAGSPGLQHLNTIAEEGDLVNKNYTQL